MEEILIFLGDLMLGRLVNENLKKNGIFFAGAGRTSKEDLGNFPKITKSGLEISI